MLGVIDNIFIESVSSTIAKDRTPVADRCRDILTKKKAERLVRGTGIQSLSIVNENLCTSDLCFTSAKALLDRNPALRNEIGAIVFISQTSDYLSPATSYYLQERLQLSKDILAFDVNLGCSGFVYGIQISAALLSFLRNRKVLLCCGDTSSRNAFPRDTSMFSIAGDAGAAAIVSCDSELGGRIYFNIDSYGERANLLLVARGGYRSYRIADENGLAIREDNFCKMDGMGVMEFTYQETPQNIESLLSFAGIASDQIELALLHQANQMIVNTLADKLCIERNRVPFMCADIGNTSSASIPVCMSEMKRNKQFHPKGIVLMSGFGVGMSVASMLLELKNTFVVDTLQI